ncbi:MAG: hypothetical protein WC510_02090 [Candidatus Omnitrophota bacterium]
MYRKIGIICIILCISMLSGCVTRLVDFNIISTKNIDLSRGASFEKGTKKVKGEDIVSMIIFIPTGVPNMETALDRAIESVPGAVALLDGVLSYKAWTILLFGQFGYVIEGTPLIDPTLASHSQLQSNYIVSKLDKKGNVVETKYVSKAEYESVKKSLRI